MRVLNHAVCNYIDCYEHNTYKGIARNWRERERKRRREKEKESFHHDYVIVCHVCIENRREWFVSDKLVNVPRQ